MGLEKDAMSVNSRALWVLLGSWGHCKDVSVVKNHVTSLWWWWGEGMGGAFLNGCSRAAVLWWWWVFGRSLSVRAHVGGWEMLKQQELVILWTLT